MRGAKGWGWGLGFLILLGLALQADLVVKVWAASVAHPGGKQVAGWITLLGSGAFDGAVALGLLSVGYLTGRRLLMRAGGTGLGAVGGGGVLVQLGKRTICRARPRFTDAGSFWNGPCLFDSFHYLSFPSGHTTTAFALAVVLAHFFPGGRALWFLLAVLVGLSRLYLVEHFLADVVAGAGLGFAVGWAVVWLSNRRWPPVAGVIR